MIDVKHYAYLYLTKEDADYYLKFFSKKNYRSLDSFIYAMKNVNLDWATNKETKNILSRLCNKMGEINEKLTFGQKLAIIEEKIHVPSMFPEFQFKQTATGAHGGICPQCGAKELFVPNHGKALYIKCNRENNCGYSKTIFNYMVEKTNSKAIALTELAKIVGIDLEALEKNNEVHIDGTSNKREIYIPAITKPSKKEEKDMVYDFFDVSRSYKEIDIRDMFKLFSKMSDNQKFMMIVTTIWLYSKESKQWGKEKYLKSRHLEKTNKFQALCEELGYLHFNDIPDLVEYLKFRFGEDELLKFGILNSNGVFKHHTESGFVVIPSFDLYTNMVTALKLRNTKLSEWQGKNLKEPEMSFGRIANPVPNGLLREHLLDKSYQFRFFEGKMDSASINFPSFAKFADLAIPGVNGIQEKQLGYFKNRVVYICFDMDEAGQKNAQILKQKLEKAGATALVVKWDANLGEDVNQVLQNGNIAKIEAKFSNVGLKINQAMIGIGNFINQMIQ